MAGLGRRGLLGLGLVLAGWLAFAGCAAAQPPAAEPAQASGTIARPAAPSLAERYAPDDPAKRTVAIVHYHRPGGDYAGWNLWAWAPDAEGIQYEFSGETPYGRYAVVELDQAVDRVGLIVRKNQWEAKDIDVDRFIEVDEDGVAEAWLVSGDPRVFRDGRSVDLTLRVVAAFLDAERRITLATTAELSDEQRGDLAVTTPGGGRYAVAGVERSDADAPGRVVYDVHLEDAVTEADVGVLTLSVPGLSDTVVYARDVLSGEAYTAWDAELGYRYEPGRTVLRTWSPVSQSAEVLLYDAQDAPEPSRVIPMRRVGRGVWEAAIEGNLHRRAYQLRFESYGKTRVAPDIHGYAATADSSRSIILDLEQLAPPGWANHTPPMLEHVTDEVIYEVHVRDFTVADPTCPPTHRGTYLGLIHENPATGDTVSTGLSHLTDLGVTAVHLLPIHDFTAELGEYNWGYWTALFNVPEANYATDPLSPESPIRDLKTAILGLHEAGVRVILDVVYNHTSTSGVRSPFHQTVPFYWFRTTADGRLRNDAGVGNSIADERPMVRKYIVDSLAFWAQQYRVDGFRFDLLGTHHPETVRAAAERLVSIRGDLTIYGEPWTGGGPIHFGKGAQRGLPVAVFNDHLRNAIRGDLDGTAVGFATGPGGDRDAIRRGVMGAIDDFTDQPTETINYASAHDNLTLWDKIVKTQPQASDATRRAMQKLALGVVLTSQGVAFLHGGSDFARTKAGNHNSYNAGDAVNRFDWGRKAAYHDVYDYVRGLIAIRRAHPAFRMHHADMVRKHLRHRRGHGLVAFELDGAAVGDSWSRILVAYNGEPTEQTLHLPAGGWRLAADAIRAADAALDDDRVIEHEHKLPGYSMAILFMP